MLNLLVFTSLLFMHWYILDEQVAWQRWARVGTGPRVYNLAVNRILSRIRSLMPRLHLAGFTTRNEICCFWKRIS